MNAKKIVVGVDWSAGSEAALVWAIDEAKAIGAEIIAVHVVSPRAAHALDAAGSGPEAPAPNPRSSVSDDFSARLQASGVDHRIFTVEGRPATEILRMANDEDACLVVVGNGLHSTMAEIFLGSVAHELTHRARRPLVIVPKSPPDVDVDALGKNQRVREGEITLTF